MNLNQIQISIVAATSFSVLGILSSVVGLCLGYLKDKKKKNTFENLLASARSRADEAKSDIVKALSQRLPEGITGDELAERLSSELRIVGDVIVNQVVKPQTQLIEELVNSYHQQALSQARVQFWFSIFAATVGFGYILYAAKDISSENWTSVVNVLPGVVIDMVAALFFRQAEQTRQRATELYDRLRTDTQTILAKDLLSSIDDITIRSIAQAQIALKLSGVLTKEFDIAALLQLSKEHGKGR